VDALGCPGDEDGDGVLDGLDRCPRTPSGVAVNASGCPSTGQGARRAQPTPTPTPPAEPAPQPQVAPEQPAQVPPAPKPAPRTTRGRPRITAGVLPGVGFAPGTARLRPESYIALDSLAEMLQADTALRVEVGAHTDNTGTPSQDRHLTNLQAEAVRTYLVTKGVPFQQVSAKGYGSSVPLTPDNTPRGRAANRRVEAKPVAPGL
jgi:OOP family OmpA-OmpF porin